MLTDSDIERALDYLRDNADAAAQAAANKTYMEEYRKSLKAMLRQESNAKTEAQRDDDAYADPRYLKHLEGLKQAVFEHERHRFMMRAAEGRIDAWRTWCANQRIGP